MSPAKPSSPPALVASIHDVSPLTRPLVELMMASLSASGIQRLSLLVIPDHHHRGHFLKDASFCEWLLALRDAGHEIIIHGYHHWRDRRTSESAAARFVTRIYTADEGEFFDIDRENARQLLARAREEFQSIGLNPTGFIAPAWLLSQAAEDALRDLGIAYTTRLGSVLDLRNGRAHRSQSLVYSVRTGPRRAASLFWNAFLFRRLADAPLLRIGAHPPDFSCPAIWRQITRIVGLALEQRASLTYQGWLSTCAPPPVT